MAYLSDDELLDTEGGFTGWDDGTGAGAEETLEQALAEERLAELESELEQDEHPIDYEAELEDEEEEVAPVSDKRLKREMRAEAIRRWRKPPAPKRISGPWWRNGTSWIGTGSAGNGTMKTSVEMCRWNIRRCRNRSSFPDG